VTKQQEYNRAYYQAHRERLIEKSRAYREAHLDDCLTRNRVYREHNREGINARKRARYIRKARRPAQPKEVAKAKLHAYYLKYKDEYAAYRQEWRLRNPERTRELNKRALAKCSPEVRRQKRLAYNAANPERVKAWKARRRADKKGAVGTYTFEQWIARVEYHGWRCIYCKIQLTPVTISIDHMIPLCRGGSNWPSNLAPSCCTCNNRKYVSTYKEYVGLAPFVGWKRRSR
jgi:5-methylcytosine-specific restriction endonuclease McrA